MKVLAHLKLENGIRIEQSLQTHCTQTAIYAARSVKTAGIFHTAYLAGILHDMGKATHKFQEYLEQGFKGEKTKRGSVNHSFAGVIYLLEHYHKKENDKWEKLTSELIAFAIGSHHGLFDCVDLEERNGFLYRLEKDREELCYAEAVKSYLEQVIPEKQLDEQFEKAVWEIRQFYEKLDKSRPAKDKAAQGWFQVGLLGRLLLSALIYGDRRDTCEFMQGIVCLQEKGLEWKMQLKYLEKRLMSFDSQSPINQVRNDISEQCLRFADKPARIYRLNVPTGAGKTLCTLRYALAHAEKYQKKRIIFIIPLLSILDQNAKVIRENILDKDMLLEHHSNVVKEWEQQEEDDQLEWITANWNAPIIISTLVQLSNILFTHKPTAILKMQALCNSVIVIDEIQSLPKKLTLMFNLTLNFLSKYCNTTILLSSATQPCFEDVDWSLQLAENPDMVRLSSAQQEVFRRAQIIDQTQYNRYGMDIGELAVFCEERLDEYASLLVICNTKKEARDLFEQISGVEDLQKVKLYHLSTAMCQRHRMDVLDELQMELSSLQKRLRDGKTGTKILCISTQLVEAGVDFSFESVVRVIAGIDNIAQAAGRCNRNNEYGNGTVYLVNLKNENLGMLPEIAEAQACTRRVLDDLKQEQNDNLLGEDTVAKFYRYLFREMKKGKLAYEIKDKTKETYHLAYLLANKKRSTKSDSDDYILHQPFKTVGQWFQVFEDQTIDVIVHYEQSVPWIEELRNLTDRGEDIMKLQKLLEKLKAYTISIYEWQRRKLDEYGLLETCIDGRVLILNAKVYHLKFGLGKIEGQTVEDFIL